MMETIEDGIRLYAYQLWLSEGSKDGFAHEHWKRATAYIMQQEQVKRRRGAHLVTCHETVVYYDIQQSSIRHGTLKDIGDEYQIVRYAENADPDVLCVTGRDTLHFVTASPDGVLSLCAEKPTERFLKMSSGTITKEFSLFYPSGFLCAEKNGSVVANRKHRSEWENFHLE